jgi:hypothetical protein
VFFNLQKRILASDILPEINNSVSVDDKAEAKEEKAAKEDVVQIPLHSQCETCHQATILHNSISAKNFS